MPNPSVTYSFTNGSVADGPQVSTNFTDLINALTDGTKDFTVLSVTATTITPTTIAGTPNFTGAVTFASTVTINGNTVIGNAITDTFSVGCQLIQMSGASLAKTSAPTLKSMYPNNQVAAWGVLTLGAAGAVTVTEGFNINTATYTGGVLTVNFHTSLSSANYSVSVAVETSNTVPNQLTFGFPVTSSRAVGTFDIVGTKRDMSVASLASGDVFHIQVIGA